MIKRCFDILVSGLGLLVAAPFLGAVMLMIYLYDRHSPLYVASRVGRGGVPFKMYKLRSMVVSAEKLGGSSTGNHDARITPVGRFIRKYKLDEFSQLWNVFKGDMSLVGPRPNTVGDVKLYTQTERRLLDIQPGITDFSSIVFSDEGNILEGAADPDLRYNQVIRPWKNRLGLLYVDNHSLWVDVQLIVLTLVTIVSRPAALKRIQKMLERLKAEELVRKTAKREADLMPYPPPGAQEVFGSH